MVNDPIKTLVQKLYGNRKARIQHLKNGVGQIPNVMGTAPRNQQELSDIERDGYDPVKALEADSHRFGSNDVGYPADAINNAKQDIEDIKCSRTAMASDNSDRWIQADQARIKKDQALPQDKLVMISNADNSRIIGKATPADVEFIYHNTHESEREINQRHPKQLFYTYRDAQVDAKKDL